MIGAATESVLISTHTFSWLDEIETTLREIPEGITVEVFLTDPKSGFFFLPSEAEIARRSADRLGQIGANVKFINWHPDFRGTIVDNRHAIILDTDCSYITRGNLALRHVASLLGNMATMSQAAGEDYRVLAPQRLMFDRLIFRLVSGHQREHWKVPELKSQNKAILRVLKNMVFETFAHPFEESVISLDTGQTIERRKRHATQS